MSVTCESKFPRAVVNNSASPMYVNITTTEIYELTATDDVINGTKIDLAHVNYTYAFDRSLSPIPWTYEAVLSNNAALYIEVSFCFCFCIFNNNVPSNYS
jgi:hypothetical protein